MKLKLVSSVIILMMICGCNCCSSGENENLGPSTELQQVVDRGSFAWLNARMWEDAWSYFHRSIADWRHATSIEELVSYFAGMADEIGDVRSLWDYQSLVNDIQNDSLYLAENPPVEIFTDQLVSGLEHAEQQLILDFGE